jgi:peptidoglycan/xylan/chitin deacetylase (PgdA/CDA1 family)
MGIVDCRTSAQNCQIDVLCEGLGGFPLPSHFRRARAAKLAVVAAMVVLGAAGAAVPEAQAATNTVVSLTFDDGHASHYATLSMLRSRGMVGTYYINSAMVGSSSYYMPWSQIHELANAGNEIGGHTLHHTNLTTVSTTQATTEVCNDRTNLLNNGFSPVASFAYPEAAYSASAAQVVQSCGYSSARMVGDISCGGGCPYAETIPPPDPYYLRTPDGITTSTTLANLQSYVTNAETHGGGWVILTFHGICDNRCTDVNSMTPSIFTAFLDWLAPRSANGTVVRTVGQVMGGGTQPPPPPPPADTTPPTVSLTSPQNGAQIQRGTRVSLTADAADVGGSGVAQVAFAVDGARLGTDTSAPYQITWNTRKAALGQHTLTAVAADGAGNSTTSAGVTVTIIR